jgi:hypothetical protein
MITNALNHGTGSYALEHLALTDQVRPEGESGV